MSFCHAYINDWKYNKRNTKTGKNYSIPNLGLFLIVEQGSILWDISWTYIKTVIHLENQFLSFSQVF